MHAVVSIGVRTVFTFACPAGGLTLWSLAMHIMETSETLMPGLISEWLTPLEEELGWVDHHRAWLLLLTTLRALRDFLPPDDAINLGSELPFAMRLEYFQGWNPAQTPVQAQGKQEFVKRIAAAFNEPPLDEAETRVRTVLELLRRRLPRDEFEHFAGAIRNSTLEPFDRVDGGR
jgi:uncharacterized protein (DUF2267 family)